MKTKQQIILHTILMISIIKININQTKIVASQKKSFELQIKLFLIENMNFLFY